MGKEPFLMKRGRKRSCPGEPRPKLAGRISALEQHTWGLGAGGGGGLGCSSPRAVTETPWGLIPHAGVQYVKGETQTPMCIQETGKT